ncbi:hypothetical protein D3C87_1596510 [compost metagenome]
MSPRLDDPHLAGVGVSLARHGQKLGVPTGRHEQDFVAGVPARHLGEKGALVLRHGGVEQDVGPPRRFEPVLFRQFEGGVRSREHHALLGLIG